LEGRGKLCGVKEKSFNKAEFCFSYPAKGEFLGLLLWWARGEKKASGKSNTPGKKDDMGWQ